MRSLSRMAGAALVVTALVFLAPVLLVPAGCSSSNNSNPDGASGGAGYTGSTRLVDLSRTDLNTLCMQETGTFSCDASASAAPIGVCTSIAASCTATVATSQACAAKLNADACNPKQLNADLASPECLVMLACTNSLCSSSTCFCPDYNSLSTCNVTCKNLSAGLTVACATCVAGMFGSSMCPDFSMLSSQCTSACAHTDGGASKG
ncbi:MAG TPA: hypothetical protein VKZ18_14865 [Polyangia bacterium]|nr:hypothetical protein [Polyangia bacterium]